MQIVLSAGKQATGGKSFNLTCTKQGKTHSDWLKGSKFFPDWFEYMSHADDAYHKQQSCIQMRFAIIDKNWKTEHIT